jgi:25S rRNA (adenine2142-N1)-methyltransferase
VKELQKFQTIKSMRLLDVGAISGDVYTKFSFLKVTSIDLNSQSPQVKKMDFFDLPIPEPKDKYNIVCLSLVINFVADPSRRGLMLSIVRKHLVDGGWFYLVLPLPCVNNSRYFSKDRHRLN